MSESEMSESEIQVGGMFGRYRILQLLGSGGMGNVYKATDTEMNEPVALKMIRREHASSREFEVRFKRELSLARQVTHKNVLRIYDLGEVNGIKYISMPFIDGEDLAKVLQRGPLPVDMAVLVASQLCAGLSAAHQAGVVHRDLKPANVLVGRNRDVYLTDFGIARSVDATQYTTTGAVVGTPEYMSPEQASGEPADATSDIYSLGLILYELFTGERPFKGETPMSRLSERIHKPARNPRDGHPQVPEYVAKIIMRCIERERVLRYDCVDEILTDFETHRSTKQSWRTRAQSWSRIVTVAAVLILMAGSYGASQLWRIYRSESAIPTTASAAAVAILPLRNATGDVSLNWLGATLADTLLADVGQSSQVRTISSDRLHQILNDLRVSLDTELDPNTIRKVADLSNADTLISGQYSKLGNVIRIDLTLQNPKRGGSTPLKAVATEPDLLRTVGDLAKSIRRDASLARNIKPESEAAKPSSQSLQALRYYSEGVQFLQQGKNSDAVRSFEAATREDSSFALAYSKLAQAYFNLGMTREAEEDSRRAVDLSARLPQQERLLIAANHAQIINDNAKTIEAYESLVSIVPDEPEFHFALGRIYEATGNAQKALEHYRRVLNRDSKNVNALLAVGRAEIRRGNAQAAMEPLNSALSLAIQLEKEGAKGDILQAIGIAYKVLNKPAEAIRYYRDALDIRRRLGQKSAIAASLMEMAQVNDRLGNVRESLASYQQALQLQREIGDRGSIGSTLTNLGNFYTERGNYDDALRATKAALQIQRDLGNKNGEAICLNNIGNVYLAESRYDEALTYFQQSLTLRKELDIPSPLADSYHNIGEVYASTGRYDEAVENYLGAMEIRRRASDKRGAAIESDGLAWVFGRQGRFGAALSAMEDSLKTFRELHERSFWLAEILGTYGAALARVGRPEDAENALDEALTVARELKTESLVAQTLSYQAESFMYRGDYRRAQDGFREALTVASQVKDSSLILSTKMNLARIATNENPREAIHSLITAAREAAALNRKDLSAACSIYLGEALLQAKDYSSARAQLEAGLSQAGKIGARLLILKAHYLLGKTLRSQGNDRPASQHLQEASRLLQEMAKEARSEEILKRSDLAPIVAEAALVK